MNASCHSTGGLLSFLSFSQTSLIRLTSLLILWTFLASPMSHAVGQQHSYKRQSLTPRIPSVPSDSPYDSSDMFSNFRDWIPVPWIRLIKEAGFRRKNPPSRVQKSIRVSQNSIGHIKRPSLPPPSPYDIPSSTRAPFAQKLPTPRSYRPTVDFSYRNQHDLRYQPKPQKPRSPASLYQKNQQQTCSCDSSSRKSGGDFQDSQERYSAEESDQDVSDEQQEKTDIFEEYSDNEIDSMCRRYYDDQNKKNFLARQRKSRDQSPKPSFDQTYFPVTSASKRHDYSSNQSPSTSSRNLKERD